MAAGEATKVVMNSLLAETKFVQAGLQEQLGEQNALQTILKTMEDILNQALSTVLSASDSSLQSQQGAQSDLLKNISKGQEEWTKTLGSS
jgi:hypothetical protein